MSKHFQKLIWMDHLPLWSQMHIELHLLMIMARQQICFFTVDQTIFTLNHEQTEKLGSKHLLRSIARKSIEEGCWSWGHKTSYDIFCLIIFSVNNGKKKTRLQASSSQYNQGVRRRRREEIWRGRRWRSSSRSWTCGCARWCTWLEEALLLRTR